MPSLASEAGLLRLLVELVRESGLTHTEVARKAGASRTRGRAILNGQSTGVSTGFLLRILYALRCRTVPTFTVAGAAA